MGEGSLHDFFSLHLICRNVLLISIVTFYGLLPLAGIFFKSICLAFSNRLSVTNTDRNIFIVVQMGFADLIYNSIKGFLTVYKIINASFISFS